MGRALCLLVTAAALAAAGAFWVEARLAEPGPARTDVTVIVPAGMSAGAIAEELVRRGVVRNAFAFLWRARWRGEAHLLRAGEYAFGPGTRIDDALETMVAGRTVMHAVTVPEGLTSAEIVALLDGNDKLAGTVARVPAEGTLLADTYHVERGALRADLVAAMKDAMDAALADLWAGRADGLPLASPRDVGSPAPQSPLAATLVRSP